MASKTRLRELGRLLNIQTVARKKYELEEQKNVSNLDFLQEVFERELEVRRQNAIRRNRKTANLPQVIFEREAIHEGTLYQIEKLKSCVWIEKSQNLLVVGKSNTNKTAIVTHLANTTIDNGCKAMYITQDEFLVVVKNKDVLQKAKITFARIKAADVLILDDFLYLDIDKNDLELLYKTLLTITSTTSIVFVANRTPQEWVNSTNDKYEMQLLINRVVSLCEKMLL